MPVPHPELGHEPFAVLSNCNGTTEDNVKSHVLQMFGQDYALRGVSSLEQIGLYEFPVNATHKIIKFQVEATVMEYLNRVIEQG